MEKTANNKKKMAPGLMLPKPEDFRKTLSGKEIALFTLINNNGLRTDITSYGGRIVSLIIPDKNGIFDDVVAGYLSIDKYLQSNEIYFGALIGRYANRIADGRFSINGKQYQLAKNNGPNHLHGGPGGLHNVVWQAEQIDKQSLKLTYYSPDMEEGSPLDFREPTPVGQRIRTEYEQLRYGNGYDHNYVLNKTTNDPGLELAASVYDPVSRRKMDVLTTEPGMQFYSGNSLTGSDKGKRGKPYSQRTSLCLETQHFPDSPNHPEFPSAILRPGEVYASKTIYRFSISKG